MWSSSRLQCLITSVQLPAYRVGVCLPFRRFAIIVAWLKNPRVITDGFKRQASPSTCMGTGILVVMRAVLHWHNGVPVPPVCNLVQTVQTQTQLVLSYGHATGGYTNTILIHRWYFGYFQVYEKTRRDCRNNFSQ